MLCFVKINQVRFLHRFWHQIFLGYPCHCCVQSIHIQSPKDVPNLIFSLLIIHMVLCLILIWSCIYYEIASCVYCFSTIRFRMFSWDQHCSYDIFQCSIFRSTTPFCCGVLGAEKLCSIPFEMQNWKNCEFSNSSPWSDWMQIISLLNFFCTNFAKVSNMVNVSSFVARNNVHVNLY